MDYKTTYMYIICSRSRKNGLITEIFKTLKHNEDQALEAFVNYCEGQHMTSNKSLIVLNRLRFIAIFGHEPEPNQIGIYNKDTYMLLPYQCEYKKSPYGLIFDTGNDKKNLYLSIYADQLSING